MAYENTNLGLITDAAAPNPATDATLLARIRGLNTVLYDVWDQVNHQLKTNASGGGEGGGGGATTIADGADTALGSVADAAITSNTTGTVSGKMRGLVAILADVWNSGSHQLKVDVSGSTLPVSAVSLPLPAGAATAAKQPALGVAGTASTDVLTVQGIASMTALKVDNSAVTQPVSAVSLPLPSGAATSAKQPALGTAGTPSTDVISIQGVVGGTAQPVSAATLPLPSGASTSAKQPTLGTAGSASVDVISIQGIAAMTAVKTDGSGVTQPVSAVALPLPSGAATSAKQPALGTAGTASTDVLTVQGIASMTALKVDNSAVTQPVSAVALPLPSGAATSAKQPALGTAGTAATDVITIQGIASMTAVKVDGSAVTQPISAVALPLPSGAATSAKQPALGTAGTPSTDVISIQGVSSGTELAVKVAAGSDVTMGNTSDAAITSDTTGTVSAKLRGLIKWAYERTPASLGQKVMASSFAVTVASDQSNIGVAVNSLPALSYSSPLTVACTLNPSGTGIGTGTYRQSDVVDNSSFLYVDAILSGSIQTGTSPTVSVITIYVWGGDSTHRPTAVGTSDATYTDTGSIANMAIGRAIQVATSNIDYTFQFSVAAALGLPCLPPKWGFIVLNGTATGLNNTATNNFFSYVGVK